MYVSLKKSWRFEMSEFQQFKDWIKQTNFLTDEDCLLFEPDLKLVQIQEKAYFLEESRICRRIGFINKGIFRVFYLMDGKEINTHFFLENGFVTDYDSLITHKPSRYFIQALENSEIVVFNIETLERAYKQSHNWERFGRMMAEKSYQIAISRTESFLFYNAEQRYMELQQKNPEILNRVPLYHIASYLGIEKESLSRIRKNAAFKGRS